MRGNDTSLPARCRWLSATHQMRKSRLDSLAEQDAQAMVHDEVAPPLPLPVS